MTERPSAMGHPEDTVDSPEQREDKDQRHQEEYLPAESHNCTDTSPADGGEKLHAQDLRPHYKGAEQKNMEIALTISFPTGSDAKGL